MAAISCCHKWKTLGISVSFSWIRGDWNVRHEYDIWIGVSSVMHMQSCSFTGWSTLRSLSCLMAGKMVHVVFSGKNLGLKEAAVNDIFCLSSPRTQKCFSMHWGACKKSCATEDKYLTKQDDAFVSAWGQIYSSFHRLLPPKSLKLAITWSSRFPSKAKLLSLPCCLRQNLLTDAL